MIFIMISASTQGPFNGPCVLADIYPVYVVLFHVYHPFLWFEFSFWVLNFTCLNFARIFIHESLIFMIFLELQKKGNFKTRKNKYQ